MARAADAPNNWNSGPAAELELVISLACLVIFNHNMRRWREGQGEPTPAAPESPAFKLLNVDRQMADLVTV